MTRLFQIFAAGILLAAAPTGPARHASGPKPQSPARERDVPGVVLIGMAVAGLAIVGASSRRRQSGRSVSS